MELYKEVGRPDAVARQFKLADMAGSHGGRAHAHGDRIRRHHRRRASLLDRPRPVPRAQRLAVQSQLVAPRTEAGRPAVRDRERYRGRRQLSHLAHARGREPRRRAPPFARRSRRLLHLRGRAPRTASACCAIRSPASRRSSPRPTTTSPSARSIARLSGLPGIEKAKVWEPEPATVYFWKRANATQCERELAIPPREVRAVRRSISRSRACAISIRCCTVSAPAPTTPHFRVLNPRGRHAIAAGVDAPVTIEIDGNVGYYCAGMNKQANIVINGSAGVGVAENMMSGRVHVKGDASAVGRRHRLRRLARDRRQRVRAAAASPIAGIDIVVKGSVGHMSAFMAQAGTLVVLGGAGDALGDSIYEARLFVRGRSRASAPIASRSRCAMSTKRTLSELLDKAGVGGKVDVVGVQALRLGAPALPFPHRQRRRPTDERRGSLGPHSAATLGHVRRDRDRRDPARGRRPASTTSAAAAPSARCPTSTICCFSGPP